MKNFGFILLLIALILITGCKKDDEITASEAPGISFISDENGFQEDDVIRGAQGQTMTIRAELTDDVGIKSFRIFYPEWDLDNTVDVAQYYPDQVLTTYTMEYNFLIPDDADNYKNHEINLTITNLGNLNTETTFTVEMDGDYEAPVITNLYPGNNSTVLSRSHSG